MYGEYKATLAPGIVRNRRAMEDWMRPCVDLCWVCDRCLNSLRQMEALLSYEKTRAFAIVSDRGFVIGAIYFLEDEIHGNMFDGMITNKVGMFKEAIELVKEDYDTIFMNVPEDSLPIAHWARRKLGFKDTVTLPHAWDGELDVVRMEV